MEQQQVILKSINELLNEEKWTRAAINSYSINNFRELDEKIKEVRKFNLENEVIDICEDHLKHSKNSIIALYISGVVSLSKQLVDDSNIIILINIFSDNHKWNIVEYLCHRILDFGENKYALRILADCYANQNEEDKKIEAWKRLIRVDYEETEIVKALAEKFEQQGNKEEAVEFYKKAIHRFINKKMFSNVKETWMKLLEFVPSDYDFYFRVEKKIASVLSGERAAALLNILLNVILDKQDWETCITVLKKILAYEPKNADARKILIDCYKQKFKDHSQLNEYIRISNLNQSWRNVHDAIADFEKHIAFDKKNFVFHRTWGIGRIRDISHDVFVIDFVKKRGHKMSLKMAINALTVLGNEHIWVLKGVMKRDELRAKIMADPAWGLRVIIKSFDNVANIKRIKAELVPDVLNANEWTKWNTEARKILKTDPSFGNLPDKRDLFVVRDTPISFEEKTYNRFKAEKNFFGRIQIIQDYLKELEPDSEYFDDMFAYFTGFAKSYTAVSELVIASFILVKDIIIQYPYLNPGIGYEFKDLYKQIDDLEGVFSRLDDNELRKEFLLYIKRTTDDWPQVFTQLFKHYQNRFIIDELAASGRQDAIKDMFVYFMNHYKEYREPFIWLVRSFVEETWFKELNVPFEKILICIVYLLDITFREINNRRDVNLNRKLNKQIQTYLFKDKILSNYLMEADENAITRLYTLIEDIKELDPTIKIKLRDKIKKRFPNFKFLGKTEVETRSRGILVTHRGYEQKQKNLRHILEVEVPQNSKDIGHAMEKGDLRENAEYKAALEKQDILNAQAAKLQEELAEAQIFDEGNIDLTRVSFSTKIKLQNLINHKEEEYIILGPWESEPSRNIISYLSPLGTKLYNHKEGEELKFTINEKHFHYRVKKIEAAQIDELVANKG